LVDLDTRILLKLFVAGSSGAATQAIANLTRVCDEDLAGRCELLIIDVLRQPEIAEREKILATPTLIKSSPPPIRRIIGDLADKHVLLAGMGLLG
jgi:circadian clock protein KaiB